MKRSVLLTLVDDLPSDFITYDMHFGKVTSLL